MEWVGNMNEIYRREKLAVRLQPSLVKNLNFAGRMSIWGIRLLATGYKLEIDVVKSLIEGFRRCNATQAGSNLLFLMEIVLEGLIKSLEINCSCNLKLTDDENKLLDLLSFGQHFGVVPEQIMLFDFLSEEAVDNVIPLFNGYGDAMRDAGLLLPNLDKRYLELLSITNLMKPGSKYI